MFGRGGSNAVAVQEIRPAPDRTWRLAACGCCRAVWARLAPVCRRAVAVAERYADGAATTIELETAWRACRQVEQGGGWRGRPGRYQRTAHVSRVAAPVVGPDDAHMVALDLRPWRGDSIDNFHLDLACEGVLRDVLGGPDAPEAPAAWRTTAVVSLARAVYERRQFSRLAHLADALESAGGADPGLVEHCRAAGPHVRGCWAVDRVLGWR